METNSNKMLVGFVMAIMLAALVAVILWKSANQRSSGRPYDIIGTQLASGLLVGSPVTYLGVPVGRVTSVEIDPARPGYVRVRIAITEDDLQITEGTVARVTGDLVFGKALVSLEPSPRAAPVLLASAGEEAPRIALQGGGIGDRISDPGPTVESIRSTVERLLEATSPEQQRILTARLEEMEGTTDHLAARAPRLSRSAASARESLRDSAITAANLAEQADLTRRSLERRNGTPPDTSELRSSLAAARDSADAVGKRLRSTRAPVQAFSQSTLGIPQKIREAREGVAPVRDSVEKVERGGIGALTSGPPTPDYQPKSRR